MRPRAGNPLPDDKRYRKGELESLLTKARRFVRVQGCEPIKCEWFCREKRRDYFDNIMKNRDGKMEKYTKDNHGDPQNPINGRLDGLFFNPCVTYSTEQPPSQSPYGDTRIKIQADKMVGWAPNLYFSDFYCVSDKEKPHYIQIVMTKPDSAADAFCRQRLVPLSSTNSRDNPFFYWTTSVVMSQVEIPVVPPAPSSAASSGESAFEDDSGSESIEPASGSNATTSTGESGVASPGGNATPEQQQSDEVESVPGTHIALALASVESTSVAESASDDAANEMAPAALEESLPEAVETPAGPSVVMPGTPPPVTTTLEYREKTVTTCYVACSPEGRPPYWLEMFYTDDVDLSVEDEPSPVSSFGRRSGGSVGLRKNTTCNTCNI